MSGSVVSMPNRAAFLLSVVNRLNKIHGRLRLIEINEYTKSDWEILPLEIHALLLDLAEFRNKVAAKKVAAAGQIKIDLTHRKETKFEAFMDWIEEFRERVMVAHSQQWERGPVVSLYPHECREWGFLLPMLAEVLNMAAELAANSGKPRRAVNPVCHALVMKVLGVFEAEELDASANGVLRVLHSNNAPSLVDVVHLMLPRDYDQPVSQVQIDRIMEALNGME